MLAGAFHFAYAGIPQENLGSFQTGGQHKRCSGDHKWGHSMTGVRGEGGPRYVAMVLTPDMQRE